MTRLTCLALALAALGLAASPARSQNQALSLTNGATDEHIDVPYAPGLFPRRTLTVEAWITYDDSTIPSGMGFRWPTIARQDVAPGGESWFLRVAAGNTGARSLQWACHNGTTNQSVNFTFMPGQFSNWTHVAATYDGNQSTLYVNGNVVGQRTVTGLLRDNNGTLRIGNGDVSSPGAEVWNGEIDELRIWPIAKTQAEIQAGMNEGLQLWSNVLTFNFDGSAVDSSSGFVGNPTAGVSYVAGAPNSVVALSAAVSFGNPSTTCMQSLDMVIPVRPTLGETSFSFVVRDATPGATGAVFLATSNLPTPLSVVGIDLLLDPMSILPTSLPGTVDATGTGRAGLFIPNRQAVVGASLIAQWLLIDGVCGAQGLTASEAIGIIVTN